MNCLQVSMYISTCRSTLAYTSLIRRDGWYIFNRCRGGVAKAKHAILYNRKDEHLGRGMGKRILNSIWPVCWKWYGIWCVRTSNTREEKRVTMHVMLHSHRHHQDAPKIKKEKQNEKESLHPISVSHSPRLSQEIERNQEHREVETWGLAFGNSR